jgi:hypothetical protein
MSFRITVEAMDLTGQNAIRLRGFPAERTVGELVTTAVSRLGLQHNDPEGRPYTYQARHESSGHALYVSEVVGDVLKTGDRIRLAPSIDAGGVQQR